LDLAQIKLSVKIPQQLSQLTFLAFFNVSYNNLTGLAPKGKQFYTFQKNFYEGNSDLCGDPLSRKCGDLDEPAPTLTPPPIDSEGRKDSTFPSGPDWIVIYMGFGSGMVVGIVMGQMLTSKHHKRFLETFGQKKNNQRRERKRRAIGN